LSPEARPELGSTAKAFSIIPKTAQGLPSDTWARACKLDGPSTSQKGQAAKRSPW